MCSFKSGTAALKHGMQLLLFLTTPNWPAWDFNREIPDEVTSKEEELHTYLEVPSDIRHAGGGLLGHVEALHSARVVEVDIQSFSNTGQ